MKKTILGTAAILLLGAAAYAGDINPGSVPGSINYQGRLERDNAPVTGIVHLYFAVYNAASGGTLRWQSPEIVANASQGIFSANILPDMGIFGRNETLYLEVQVEGETLSPREPLNTVAFALVAKRLEDGASVSVTTFTAAYQVLLATMTNSNVGIGTNDPISKLTVNGTVRLEGAAGQVCFPSGNCMTDAGVGTAVGGINATGNISIESGNSGTGVMSFITSSIERMRLMDTPNGGVLSIGPAAITNPSAGMLDVDGIVFVSTWGVSERSGGAVPFNDDIWVKGGRVTGNNAEYIALGEINNTVQLVSGGGERLRVHSNGYVGVANAAPAYPLDVTGDIHTNTGLLAGSVSVGPYTGWLSAANEVRAPDLTHLLLQQNNPYNVGIGTDTPREKLHVRGSVRADRGVISSTAAFSSDVYVQGDFRANGHNKNVYLTTTTIYGTLTVTGGIGSTAGFPAYLASTQTLTGQNTFANQVEMSSDVISAARLGVGVRDFDFAGGRYLQVGDNKPEYASQNSFAYLVGGDSANSRLVFYRGAQEAGSLGSHGGANIGLIIAGSTKTLADATYYRVQNSVVWISTGFNSTPAVYVSSGAGNVGIGTTVSDSTYKLTVNGSLRIAGPTSNGIVFADGTTMESAAVIGSATGISNAGDAIVAANTLGGGGSVVLRSGSVDALVADSGGNVGVGTLYPVSKFNVRGGDLLVGNPVNPYSANGVDDLLVAGSVVFDGALIQRSASAVNFSGLVVAGDVYLSTGTAKRTGVGTNSPATTLDVNGNAQFGQGTTRSTFTAAGVLQLASSLGLAYGGTGAATAAGARTNLGLAIGTNIQAYDDALQSISGLATVADRMIYTTGADTYALTPLTAAGRAILDDTDATAQRATLGLVIGTNVQAYDDALQSIAGLATVADRMIYTTAADTYAVATLTAAGRALLDDAAASDQRTTLGLAIGSNVQAYDAALQSISGLATVADRMIYTTAADTYAVATLTAAGRAILDDTDATAQRTTLGLDIGSDVQGYDATLAGIAALAPIANQMIYATGADSFAAASLTAAGRAILDDATASDQRNTLGLTIGSNVQGYDDTLAGIAALAPTANTMIYANGADSFTTASLTLAGRNLLDDASASDQRTTLGLAIGSNVQAYDSDLGTIAGLTAGNGSFLVGDGTNWTTESGSTARSSLGLGSGVTGVMTIRNAGGAADCTVTYSNGIVTGTTCNFI